jgi:hypothetical protein
MAEYVQYVLENTSLFDFLNQSRTGGTPALRGAIRDELHFFGHHLSTELSKFLPRLKSTDLDMIAQLIVSALVENTTILLTLPKDATAQKRELEEMMSRQIRLILLGAEQWQNQPGD